MLSTSSMPHKVPQPSADFRASLQPQHLQLCLKSIMTNILPKADSGMDLSSWLKFY